jgi:hypothetical protein
MRGPVSHPTQWRLFATAWSLVALLVVVTSGEVARRDARETAEHQAATASTLHAAVLRSELERHRSLPMVLAQNPDRAAVLRRPDATAAARLSRKFETLARDVRAAAIYALDAEGGWPAWRPRPLRLLPRPEVLEAVIALTPDEPPRQFRWRGRVHRIRLAEGPERIGAEWWRTGIEAVRTDQVRDYYRVEDQDGARLWVFRSGLHDHDRPVRWWLHGLFG